MKLKEIPINPRLDFFLVLLGYPLLVALSSGLYAGFQSFLIFSLLFSIVILHEYGHCWAAIRANYNVKDITLMCLGGLARIESAAFIDAQTEAFITLCGPLVNFILAFLTLPLFFILPQSIGYYIAIFGMLNLVIGILNLIPAFPLDGGRLLRCFLSWYIGSRYKATRITAIVGLVISVSIVIASIFIKWIILGIIFIFVGVNCYAMIKNQSYFD